MTRPLIQLDLQGLNCPLPILQAKKSLAQLQAGDKIEIVCTDPATPGDFADFCRKTGYQLLHSRQENGIFIFLIQKPQSSATQRSQTLTITRPDDWHLHLRDADFLDTTLAHTAAQFGRAIIMPNLKPPVTTVTKAAAYRKRIIDALPTASYPFTPLMTLYLTDTTSTEEIYQAKSSGFIYGVKLYPAGATTHAEAGVTDIHKLDNVLSALVETRLPLLIHGEIADKTVDIFDREAIFITHTLQPLVEKYPDLKIVLEHITTEGAVTYVTQSSKNIAATITPHHLLLNRNDMLAGGIRPHYYCMPLLKRESDRIALLNAATSGNPQFFIGTDSAPHLQSMKETACGCAGIYSAHAALAFYAQAFESVGALDKLEAFASFHGPDFYNLARNTTSITLKREAWRIPDYYPCAQGRIIPFYAGQLLDWKL